MKRVLIKMIFRIAKVLKPLDYSSKLSVRTFNFFYFFG